MKNKVIFLVIGLALVVLLAVATLFYDELSGQYGTDTLTETAPNTQQDTSSQEENQPVAAPDFTVMAQDGSQVKLSDFLGQPVIVNFWASWCGPCKNEMPAFQQAWETYGDRIRFLMVNLTDNSQETVDSAKRFLASTDYTFPVYFDTQLSGAAAYGVVGIPATYFIDEDGYVVAGANTSLDYDTLEYGISLLLKEQ